MNIWIVGKYKGEIDDGTIAWEFQGAFESKDLALAACFGKQDYFIAPALINEIISDATEAWPGCYYPKESE